LLEQRLDPQQVVALAAGEVEGHRTTPGIDAQVQLCRRST
jgi:hypothetical protein